MKRGKNPAIQAPLSVPPIKTRPPKVLETTSRKATGGVPGKTPNSPLLGLLGKGCWTAPLGKRGEKRGKKIKQVEKRGAALGSRKKKERYK